MSHVQKHSPCSPRLPNFHCMYCTRFQFNSALKRAVKLSRPCIIAKSEKKMFRHPTPLTLLLCVLLCAGQVPVLCLSSHYDLTSCLNTPVHHSTLTSVPRTVFIHKRLSHRWRTRLVLSWYETTAATQPRLKKYCQSTRETLALALYLRHARIRSNTVCVCTAQTFHASPALMATRVFQTRRQVTRGPFGFFFKPRHLGELVDVWGVCEVWDALAIHQNNRRALNTSWNLSTGCVDTTPDKSIWQEKVTVALKHTFNKLVPARSWRNTFELCWINHVLKGVGGNVKYNYIFSCGANESR